MSEESEESEGYEIPRFFRILIIDDIVAASQDYKEFFTNILTALVLEEADGKIPMAQVDVVFEYDPAKGFKRWQNEPFDLTLIDADFSTNRGTADDTNDLAQYVLNSRDQGLQIFKLLETQMNKSGLFAYRNKMCRFFVWTALPDKDENGKSGLYTLLCRFGITKQDGRINKDAVINKNEESLGTLRSKIDACVEDILNNAFTPAQKIERLLFALRKEDDILLRDVYGGCLVFDSEQKYTFLPTLGEYLMDGSGTHIRLCCAHIPESLLLADEEQSETRFLPLHRNIICGKAIDAIDYLLQGKDRNKITDYCNSLQERQKKQEDQQRLPWFPASTNTGSETEKPSFIAAATPLTGTTVIGANNAVSSLCDKVRALLSGPFDKVILKTTYLDRMGQWENACWPSVHIQSHMRTRCLYPDTGTPTLWNSGKTAMEMLPPHLLNTLLVKLKNEVADTSRLIVSLGSKFHKQGELSRGYRKNLAEATRRIWSRLFEDVFKGLNGAFPIVEINVRHFLREIVKYYLGGDEYLNPRTLDEKCIPAPESYWEEFRLWLEIIHEVAIINAKQLFLKLPHRSDSLAYVKCVVSLREYQLARNKEEGEKPDFGVKGVTLVNALKTPVPQSRQGKIAPFSPAWYADPSSWGDAKDKLYQMSGRLVGPYRNQILAGLIPESELEKLRKLNMEIWISGGLTSNGEVRHCLSLEDGRKKRVIAGIQIGTWGLIETDLKNRSWKKKPGPPAPAGQYELDTSNCLAICPNCDILNSCSNNALQKKMGKRVQLKDASLCWSCMSWNCIDECKSKRLFKKLKGQAKQKSSKRKENRRDDCEAFTPRFSYLEVKRCQACGRCMSSFYCDTFIDRANTNLPPWMDNRYCSGCGLCVQICPSGALQLYRPDEFLVLISSSSERKEILDAQNIPNLQYIPERDLENFPYWIHDEFIVRFNSTEPKKNLERFWKNRLEKDTFMLNDGKKLDIKGKTPYPEKRDERKKSCIDTAMKLLSSITNNKDDGYAGLSVNRAVCWSQLIWSDPGQVLWDSFLLTVQSVIETNDGAIVPSDVTIASLREKAFCIKSRIILLRRGSILINEDMESQQYQLAASGKKISKYIESCFGKGRAAGLDIRACGDDFVQHLNGGTLSGDDKMELAGLPWKKIKNTVAALPGEQQKHRDAFMKLCDAVKQRG